MYCIYCGNKLLEEAKFCHICGRFSDVQEDVQLVKRQENGSLLKDNNKKIPEEKEEIILAIFFVFLCLGAIIYLVFY